MTSSKLMSIFVLILSIFLESHVNCQSDFIPDRINFKHLGAKDGLIQNIINGIAKDSKGFIWIGTTNGLYRYDGYEFIYYRNIPEDTTSLSGNDILSILLDSKNRLWISTMNNGLNLYNSELDCFKQIRDKDYSYQYQIKKIIERTDSTMLLASLGVGLLIYNIESNTIEPVKSKARIRYIR